MKGRQKIRPLVNFEIKSERKVDSSLPKESNKRTNLHKSELFSESLKGALSNILPSISNRESTRIDGGFLEETNNRNIAVHNISKFHQYNTNPSQPEASHLKDDQSHVSFRKSDWSAKLLPRGIRRPPEERPSLAIRMAGQFNHDYESSISKIKNSNEQSSLNARYREVSLSQKIKKVQKEFTLNSLKHLLEEKAKAEYRFQKDFQKSQQLRKKIAGKEKLTTELAHNAHKHSFRMVTESHPHKLSTTMVGQDQERASEEFKLKVSPRVRELVNSKKTIRNLLSQYQQKKRLNNLEIDPPISSLVNAERSKLFKEPAIEERVEDEAKVIIEDLRKIGVGERAAVEKKEELKEKVKLLFRNVVKWHRRARKMNMSLYDLVYRNIIPKEAYSMPMSKNFMVAISMGEVQQIFMYLKKNPRFVYEYDSIRRTPLHKAVYQNDIAMTRIFLTYSPDLEATDVFNNTPLSLAVANNNLQIVKELLLKGADPILPVVKNTSRTSESDSTEVRSECRDLVKKARGIWKKFNGARKHKVPAQELANFL